MSVINRRTGILRVFQQVVGKDSFLIDSSLITPGTRREIPSKGPWRGFLPGQNIITDGDFFVDIIGNSIVDALIVPANNYDVVFVFNSFNLAWVKG